MLKKITVLSIVALSILSCGSSYTAEQAEAAVTFCECMEKDEFGDYDINYLECGGEDIITDEASQLALKDNCPDVASKILDATN